ncbi:hypothetical protein Tco_0117909 [Tanacetum coccineum]
MALLAQYCRATLSQTNNQLRTSSNTRNQATIQDGWVVVQNVQGRHNQNQRYFAQGNGTTRNGGAQKRAGNANAVLMMRNPLFLAGEQGNTFDADVDNQPVQDLALNEDNIFQADECDAFDSDVDDEPTAQSIFMANLSSVGSANPQAGPSNASILSEVHILENAIDHSVSNQDEHEIHNKVQPSNVIDSTSVHMGNSNVIPYEQYLSVNDISVVPSCASSALNSVCVSPVNDAIVPHDPIAIELKIYKEQGNGNPFLKIWKPKWTRLRTETYGVVVIERKNLLITNENLLAECLSKVCIYTALEFCTQRCLDFQTMHDAFN